MMQLGNKVQQGDLFMIGRRQLLISLDIVCTLAHRIPAIVVPVCVTTMVGLLLIPMMSSSSLYMKGS